MKIIHDFLALFMFPIALMLDGDAGGGGAGGEGAGGAPAGGAPAGGAPGAFDIRQHVDDSGGFKPGWAKALGMPETVEAKFTRPEALARSYASLEKQIGAKGVIVPGANATQAERDAFYNAMGRPEKPEGYDLKKPDKLGDKALPDGLWDDKGATEFAKWAHEHGWSKQQVQDAMQYDLQRSMSARDGFDKHQAEQAKLAKDSLTKEWGADFDKNLTAAKRAAKDFGGDELLNHPALGNDPVLIKALAKMGAATAERGGGAGTRESAGNGSTTPAEAKVAANKLTQTIAANLKADRNWNNSPEAAQMKAEKTRLFQLAHPEGA